MAERLGGALTAAGIAWKLEQLSYQRSMGNYARLLVEPDDDEPDDDEPDDDGEPS